MELHQFPKKIRTSFDIPRLLALIREEGSFSTSATFADIMTVRNYISRHKIPWTLGQALIRDSAQERVIGYTLTLRPREMRGLEAEPIMQKFERLSEAV